MEKLPLIARLSFAKTETLPIFKNRIIAIAEVNNFAGSRVYKLYEIVMAIRGMIGTHKRPAGIQSPPISIINML